MFDSSYYLLLTLASKSASLPFWSEICFMSFLFSSFMWVTSMFCLVAPVRNSWIWEKQNINHACPNTQRTDGIHSAGGCAVPWGCRSPPCPLGSGPPCCHTPSGCHGWLEKVPTSRIPDSLRWCPGRQGQLTPSVPVRTIIMVIRHCNNRICYNVLIDTLMPVVMCYKWW